jgi:ABC-type uncharacterized transport system involved in gliding motility auxiliary subunit
MTRGTGHRGAGGRRLWSALAIPAAIAAFLGVVWLAETTLTRARIDLTEERRHTLSEATRRVLAAIEEPIVLSYYRSAALDTAAPELADYARRVRELLQHYVRLADGGLKLELYRPEPFSPEEDLAVAAGLQGLEVGTAGRTAYFGLAGRNSTDDRETIPLFAPERARFLEYDLTRLVYALANPDRPRVGVLTALPLFGDPAGGVAPWRVVARLREGYALERLDPDAAALPDDLDALLLAQATGLSPALREAVVDWAAAGRPLLAFVDPFSETLAAGRAPGAPPQADAVAEAAPLLQALGLRLDGASVIGDRSTARRVRARVAGRTQTLDYLPWLGLGAQELSATDPATANLNRLALNAAGHLAAADGAPVAPQALARSSDRAMPVPVARIATAPDPAALLSDFVASGETYVPAVRVRGGPDRLNAVVVADADLLDDAVWTRRQQVQGREVTVPVAGNGDFVANLMDTLTGAEGLLDLRGRGVADRPFTVIEAMREAAETEFRARERALSAEVQAAERRIRELRRRERTTGVVLSDAQQAEIDRLRGEMLTARGELRAVQHQLRADVEALQNRLQLLVTWGMPALVALLALVLALLRRRRRGRRPAAAG